MAGEALIVVFHNVMEKPLMIHLCAQVMEIAFPLTIVNVQKIGTENNVILQYALEFLEMIQIYAADMEIASILMCVNVIWDGKESIVVFHNVLE
jgi:hypothetical protein